MTQALKELLFAIRQHPAYPELLAAVEAPAALDFKPSGDAQQQYAEFIHRSGRRQQHLLWRSFLTGE